MNEIKISYTDLVFWSLDAIFKLLIHRNIIYRKIKLAIENFQACAQRADGGACLMRIHMWSFSYPI